MRGNRLTGLRGENDRQTYARAKATMAIVVSPPSRRKLQPIAPSADWRFDLAEGCPAHCQYCYLAGSLGFLTTATLKEEPTWKQKIW